MEALHHVAQGTRRPAPRHSAIAPANRRTARPAAAGMTAPGCVEGTGRYAVEHGYVVTLVRDATAAYTPELLRAAHEQTGPLWAGAIVTTGEILAACRT